MTCLSALRPSAVDRVAGPVLQAYLIKVAENHFQRDAAQVAAAVRLDKLCEALAARGQASKSSVLGWFFQQREVPKGIYIHGSVGRGKTMLMDLFFDHVPGHKKRRVHFHAFMADVHARVHAWRQARKRGENTGPYKGDDPIAPVAEALAAQANLLCFDEFSVTDIADAMLLGRLFQALFARGVVIVATSNVAPDDLYRDGLNRALFLPFIALIDEKMDVLRLDAARDFRLEKLSGTRVWHVPADAAARHELDRAFALLAGGEKPKPMQLPLLGRAVHVPLAAGNVARFSFADLCEQPLGASDYLALAQQFHSILVDDIPVIAPDARNVAKRFINLVDTLYDAHVKLIASAASEPAGLYQAPDGYENFEFSRTVSRLIEMRGEEYLALPHGRSDSQASGDTSGLVDT